MDWIVISAGQESKYVFSKISAYAHCVKKSPYSELFWSVFSRIWTECGEKLRISPYSFRMRENTGVLEVKDKHVNRDEFVNDDLKNELALRADMKQV